MSTVWITNELDLLDVAKPTGLWGSEEGYPEPATPYSTHNSQQELDLLFSEASEGVTIRCPDIELTMCGRTEGEAWQSFLGAFNDLKHFLEENVASLSPELSQRLAILRKETAFRFIRDRA